MYRTFVRFGSKAEVMTLYHHARFTPNSDLKSRVNWIIAAWPLVML
jgi:hypothetical protein